MHVIRPLVACLVAGVVVAAQSGATVLQSVAAPRPQQIGAFYFDAGNRSEVWMNLVPPGADGAPGVILLNFTIAFAGRTEAEAPSTVAVRAQPVCATFFGVPRAELRFTLASPTPGAGGPTAMDLTASTTLDLTAPGEAYQFISGCVHDASDTIVAERPFADLRTLSAASQVDAVALGRAVRFTTGDLAALRQFVDVVSHPIEVR